jgi:hypothetical protein
MTMMKKLLCMILANLAVQPANAQFSTKLERPANVDPAIFANAPAARSAGKPMPICGAAKVSPRTVCVGGGWNWGREITGGPRIGFQPEPLDLALALGNSEHPSARYNDTPHIFAVDLYLKAHRWDLAMAELNATLSKWYASHGALARRADIYALFGYDDLAAADLDAAIMWVQPFADGQGFDEHNYLYVQRAFLYAKKRQFAEADAMLQKSNPASAFAAFKKAQVVAYLRQQQSGWSSEQLAAVERDLSANMTCGPEPSTFALAEQANYRLSAVADQRVKLDVACGRYDKAIAVLEERVSKHLDASDSNIIDFKYSDGKAMQWPELKELYRLKGNYNSGISLLNKRLQKYKNDNPGFYLKTYDFYTLGLQIVKLHTANGDFDVAADTVVALYEMDVKANPWNMSARSVSLLDIGAVYDSAIAAGKPLTGEIAARAFDYKSGNHDSRIRDSALAFEAARQKERDEQQRGYASAQSANGGRLREINAGLRQCSSDFEALKSAGNDASFDPMNKNYGRNTMGKWQCEDLRREARKLSAGMGPEIAQEYQDLKFPWE